MCVIPRHWRDCKLKRESKPELTHKMGRMHRASSMALQQVAEFCQPSLLIGSEVVMDVPAQVIMAKIEIVICSIPNDVIECVQPEIARLSQLSTKGGILDTASQSPDRVNEWQFRQFEPGGA